MGNPQSNPRVGTGRTQRDGPNNIKIQGKTENRMNKRNGNINTILGLNRQN